MNISTGRWNTGSQINIYYDDANNFGMTIGRAVYADDLRDGSKKRFAEGALSKKAPFDTFDFANFLPIFEVINDILNS